MRRQGLSVLFFLVFAFGISQVYDDKLAFSYGVLVAVVNLVIASVYLSIYRRRVLHYVGQSLNGVIVSWLTRILVVGGLLIFGLTNITLNSTAILAGFILGQVYFMTYQLIGLANYGK